MHSLWAALWQQVGADVHIQTRHQQVLQSTPKVIETATLRHGCREVYQAGDVSRGQIERLFTYLSDFVDIARDLARRVAAIVCHPSLVLQVRLVPVRCQVPE